MSPASARNRFAKVLTKFFQQIIVKKPTSFAAEVSHDNAQWSRSPHNQPHRSPSHTHVMDPILHGLNHAQREAVTSSGSVLQVLAPPGSGKTKTLTARVAYLLSHHGYQPQDVICCTFTIKASREMRERLAKLIGEKLESRLILGTFHSICRRYLVKYGYLIGLRKGFGIADSDDTRAIIRVRFLSFVWIYIHF
jgi:hypothetical protein